ncbi:hypothetical protein FYK55_15165 [Roseiconus nitratireducens]|uniref:Secreted protein n=1 Tax=Roseiconus nitratireducens TaxID=2605748 RepID=A0A5M6D3R5_9BACT|nr:hypothetical protein [Roseiconus nitratireducens]KAA5542147.1 hypothetical protein FYK55_15165 [Roseiconus nitratireducens]
MRAAIFSILLLVSRSLHAADDPALVSQRLTNPPRPTMPAIDQQQAEEIELQRFKKQALQNVSIGGGAIFEFDDRTLNQSFLELSVGTGIPLGGFDSILGIEPRVRVDWIDAIDSLDVPESLYDFQCQFFYRRPIRQRLSFLTVVSPSYRSDLTTSEDAVRVFALALLNWECVPQRLTLSAGAVALGRADLPVLPAFGVVWTPTPRSKLDLRFPLARCCYRLAKDGGRSEIWAYASGGLGGNTWSVTRANGQPDELSLRDYRLLMGVERLVDGGGRCFAETGIALGRRLEYERDDQDIDFGDAFLIQAGWRY